MKQSISIKYLSLLKKIKLSSFKSLNKTLNNIHNSNEHRSTLYNKLIYLAVTLKPMYRGSLQKESAPRFFCKKTRETQFILNSGVSSFNSF